MKDAVKVHRKGSRYSLHQFTVSLFKGVNDCLNFGKKLIIGL